MPYDMRLMREVQDYMNKTLRACRVYAVDEGAIRELHRAFEKEGRKTVVYTDAPPAVPMWIEFLGSDVAVGSHYVQEILIRASPSGDE